MAYLICSRHNRLHDGAKHHAYQSVQSENLNISFSTAVQEIQFCG
jgi:hypothetical protein